MWWQSGMSAFCLVLFVQGLTPLVERLVLRVNRCGVRFEGKQMGLQFLAVHPVIDCAWSFSNSVTNLACAD